MRRSEIWALSKEVPGREISRCVCCGRRSNLKHVENVGDICLECFLTQPICKKSGCFQIAVTSDFLCRKHFCVGEMEEPFLSIDFHGGYRSTYMKDFEEVLPLKKFRKLKNTRGSLEKVKKSRAI